MGDLYLVVIALVRVVCFCMCKTAKTVDERTTDLSISFTSLLQQKQTKQNGTKTGTSNTSAIDKKTCGHLKTLILQVQFSSWQTS